ncbi:hypothetical protein [Streptomyces flavidovirens]|uniref:hypothetical protein n=1 Tax=Streptomyces flavidovirens TaxID=67298 RepID=UPI00369494A7
MAETFECDWDGSSAVEVRHDDSHVEIRVAELEGGDEFLLAYLAPETARRFARSVTLASFAVEGEEVADVVKAAEDMKDTMDTGAPSEPCPETNDGCDPLCSARPECHASAMRDLFQEPDTEPVPYALVDEHEDRADAFLAARELAGPAANLDDVLKLAQFLEG